MKTYGNSREGIPPQSELEVQLADDLADLYHFPVPPMRFHAERARAQGTPLFRRWKPATLVGAVATGAAVLLGAVLVGGSTATVSAQELLERTQAVTTAQYAPIGGESYHMAARSSFSGAGGGATIVETWFAGPEQNRTETRDAETGEVLFGHVRNGDDYWLYAHQDGDLVAVHSTLSDTAYGVTFASPAKFPGVNGLSDLIGSFSTECSNARSAGEDVVAGREVYVIEVTPKPEPCKGTLAVVASGTGEGGGPRSVAVGGAIMEGDGEQASGTVVAFSASSGPTRMWIDKETFMTLRSESTGDGFSFTHEVTVLETELEFGDETFGPPEGARIIEAESFEDANSILKGMFQLTPLTTEQQ